MKNNKIFCKITKKYFKYIPIKTWIRYIDKNDISVNKGGILIKYYQDKNYLLLRSPKSSFWRIDCNKNYIYIEEKLLKKILKKKK